MIRRVRSFNRTATLATTVSLGILIVLACAASVFAGGFQLAVEAPHDGSTSIKDAALIVRTYGCGQPADANVTVTAEGIVNNRRQTVPVDLKPDAKGVYAITRQWPQEGKWVLVLTGAYNGMTSTVFVELDPRGGVYPDTYLKAFTSAGTHARGLRRKPTTEDVEAALKSDIGAVAMTAPSSPALPPGVIGASGAGAFVLLFGLAALRRRRRETKLSPQAASDVESRG